MATSAAFSTLLSMMRNDFEHAPSSGGCFRSVRRFLSLFTPLSTLRETSTTPTAFLEHSFFARHVDHASIPLIIYLIPKEDAKGGGRRKGKRERSSSLHRTASFLFSLLFLGSLFSYTNPKTNKRGKKHGHLNCIVPWLLSRVSLLFSDRGGSEAKGRKERSGSHGHLG